jgi:hypothetical protein
MRERRLASADAAALGLTVAQTLTEWLERTARAEGRGSAADSPHFAAGQSTGPALDRPRSAYHVYHGSLHAAVLVFQQWRAAHLAERVSRMWRRPEQSVQGRSEGVGSASPEELSDQVHCRRRAVLIECTRRRRRQIRLANNTTYSPRTGALCTNTPTSRRTVDSLQRNPL